VPWCGLLKAIAGRSGAAKLKKLRRERALRRQILTALSLLMVSGAMAGDGGDEMKPYPKAAEGYARAVIHLDALAREEDSKLEIIIGKPLQVDCNAHWFGGDLASRVAEGWGYPYHVLASVHGPASTMKACPPGFENREAFVPVRGEGYLLRYNSKLPVVVYVPTGFEVRYRIWKAGEEIGDAEWR
jgi:ecotin